jgi:CTP:molybdopterin cytidylyltransferase MocA
MDDGGVRAVVLAAGEGARDTRSGGRGHKLLAPFRGRTVVEWAIAHAVAAAVGPVSVVVGAVEVPMPGGVEVIANPGWAAGIATSLRAAVDAAAAAGAGAVVVGLGDQPLVEPEAWRRVAAATPATAVAVATYAGGRGHPVRLPAAVWPLLPRTGDEAARTLMRAHPELVLEVPCPGSSADVDTVEDLSRWS